MAQAEIIKEAQAATAQKDWLQAAMLWKQVVDEPGMKPKPAYLRNHARALRGCGQLDKAEAAISSALENFPDDKAVVMEAAEISHALSDWLRAEERWARSFELLGKKSPPANVALKRSETLEQLGAFDKGAQLLAAALKEAPDNIALRNAEASMEVAKRRGNPRPGDGADAQPREGLDVSAVCQCFWDIENSRELARWQVNGVHPWPLIRMQLYYSLAQKLGLYDAPHPTHKTAKAAAKLDPLTASALSKIAKLGKSQEQAQPLSTAKPAVSAATLRGWRGEVRKLQSKFEIWRAQKSGVELIAGGDEDDRHAVIMATRKIRGSEPQSEATRAELGDRALLLDRPMGDPLTQGAIDFDALVTHFRTKYRDQPDGLITVEDRMVCEDIRDHFLARLNYDIGDLAGQCARAIVTFKSVRTGFRLLWQAYPVKTVFLTNAYGITTRAAMVAAQEAGIRTVEFQHGFISRFHLGYSWPGHEFVPYTPDELWCFGDYWHEVTPLPGNVKGRTIGAPYVKRIAASATSERQDDLVVFTSQGVIGQRLVEWAVETARKRPDKKVVFRLHPSEMLEQYDHIEQTMGPVPENFFISHRDPTIFELLAQASIQVGAFSTTLLEGMSLGTRTAVANLPGAEYMHPVIDRGDVLFVDTIEQLVERLDEAPLARNPFHYYAKPVTPLLNGSARA